MNIRQVIGSRMRTLLVGAFAIGMAALIVFSPAISRAADVVPIGGSRPVKVRPYADGTIVDGGSFGDFDGVPDDADWAFDDTGYDGAITLATETPGSSLEHRVVWEYTVWGLGLEPPVVATLVFTARGAPVFPLPDAVVSVYSYRADLQETLDDFSAEPMAYHGSVTVEPFQDPTVFRIDVSKAVNTALETGRNTVGIRFQIDPETPHARNQAFIDAHDDEPTSKPYLSIRPPGVLPEPSDQPDEPLDPVPGP